MNGAVNGISINGTALPSWVVRAVVVAAAAATVDSSEPTRTTYAAAFGDAAVSVSLTQTHTIQARATGTATNTAQPIASTHIYRPTASGTATATATADATRVVMPSASAQTESLTYGPKARIKYVATGTSTAAATVVQALGVRMAMAHQDSATAGATLAEGIVFGMQHWGAADGMLAIGADQRAKADASYAARSGASLAMAVTLDSTATRIQQAHVADVLATALVGRAYALANSEIRAPDDRYMIVGQEDRAMVVSTEERLMVVTA